MIENLLSLTGWKVFPRLSVMNSERLICENAAADQPAERLNSSKAEVKGRRVVKGRPGFRTVVVS